MSRFGKREEGIEVLIQEAVTMALESCGTKGIDMLYLGTVNPEEFVGTSNFAAYVTDILGLTPTPAVRLETAMSSGGTVFQQGFLAVKSGLHKNVLVVGAEKMTDLNTAAAARILAKVIAPSERIYGATMPALGAMVTRIYMHEYGMTREAMAQVAVKNHHNASLNPYAHFQKELDLKTAMEGKIISDPLTIYDCAPISDGACAAVLTSDGGDGDVDVAGIGQATDTFSILEREELTSYKATRLAAKKAYEMSSFNRKDIDVAELHDAFTSFEIINSEDVGFFGRGEGWKAVTDGRTQLNGDIPVNTSGGHKARGHPIGASGLAQIVELFWQLRGEAGKRQIDGAKTAMAQNIGGFCQNNIVTILKVR